MNVSGHTKIGRVDNLVCAGVVEDGLGVDTGFVGEGAETSDVVVEGNVDFNGSGNKILNVLELLELVLALDVFRVGDHHTGHETTKGVLPSVYQGNYNAVARRIEAELLPVLRENNIRFYAYSPIAGGFLTKTKEQLLAGGEGRWDPNSAIGQIYHRLYNKPAMLEVLDDWAEIAKAEGVTKAELAYRWIFFHSHIREDLGDAVIVGATKISQFEETIAAIQRGPLSADAVKRIDAVWEKIKDVATLDNFNA